MPKWKEGYQRVRVKHCVPNDWNMNEMDPEVYKKTKLGVMELYEEKKSNPPIVCRVHPQRPKRLQIIDGFHRWKMFGEEDIKYIDAYVYLELSDKRAELLTAQLNYNRGEANPEKYADYLARLIRDQDAVDAEYLSQRLPESRSEIEHLISTSSVKIEEVKILDDDNDSLIQRVNDASEMDHLVEVKFSLRQSAAEVVERELSRLGKLMGGTGKNIRGRALECMAVLSSQTPAESISGLNVEAEMEKKSEDVEDMMEKAKKKAKKKKKKHKEE